MNGLGTDILTPKSEPNREAAIPPNLDLIVLEALRSDLKKAINDRMNGVFSTDQLLVLEHNFFSKIVWEVTTQFPDVKKSSWYHVVIGSSFELDACGSDDLPAYEKLKDSLVRLSQEIQTGKHDEVFLSYMLRRNIACIVR